MEVEFARCALCNSDNTKKLFEGKDFLHSLPGRFRVVQCKNCGLVYVNPRPSQEKIKPFYPKEYSAHQRFEAKRSLLRRTKDLLKKWFRIKRRAIFIPLKKGKILDIGCGSGKFLSQFKNRGWKCWGVEPSPAAAQRAKKLGLDIFAGDLLEANYPENFFDLITLNHVFEHLFNPNEILLEISRILKPDGILRIYLPNIQSLVARIFKSYWFNLDIPRHLYHFSPKTLGKILVKNGFRLKKIKYVSSTAGVLGSLQYLTGGRMGIKINLRKNIFLSLLFKPFVKLVDILKIGDSFYAYAVSNKIKQS